MSLNLTILIKSLCSVRIIASNCLLFISIISFSCRKSSPFAAGVDPYQEAHRHSLLAVNKEINDFIGGYYAAVPSTYALSELRYPVFICLHGSGQFGDGKTNLQLVLDEATPERLKQNTFPSYFEVNGQTFSPILLIPQFRQTPTMESIRTMIDFFLSNYRIDSTRISLIGFSAGGELAVKIAASMPQKIAAVTTIAGSFGFQGLEDLCDTIANSNIGVWVFHNDNDEIVAISEARYFVTTLQSFSPLIPPKFTIFPRWGPYGHDAWTKATDPNYREDGMNIYEWMLQFQH